MRQTAVADIQKRLTRCFRALEAASQQRKTPKNAYVLVKVFISRAEACSSSGYDVVRASPMKKRKNTPFTERLLVAG